MPGMRQKEKLIPPDLKRCQAESRSFMTFGPGLTRCGQVPTVIATEPKRRGQTQGEMALCDACMRECIRRVPGVSFRPAPPIGER